MPNSDWITLREGKEIIRTLKNHMLLILEKSEINNKNKNLFFPAKGMKEIAKFLKEEFLLDYKYISDVNTFERTWLIFIKNKKLL